MISNDALWAGPIQGASWHALTGFVLGFLNASGTVTPAVYCNGAQTGSDAQKVLTSWNGDITSSTIDPSLFTVDGFPAISYEIVSPGQIEFTADGSWPFPVSGAAWAALANCVDNSPPVDGFVDL